METRLKDKIARLTDAQKQKVADYVDFLLAQAAEKGVISEPAAIYETSGKKQKAINPTQTINRDTTKVIDDADTGKKLKRKFGSLKGVITYIANDFDEPLGDFNESLLTIAPSREPKPIFGSG